MRADLRTNDVLPHDRNVNAAPLRCIAKLQWVQLDFTDQIAIFFELSEDLPNLFANGSVAKLLKTNNHCFGKSLDSWSSGLGQPIKKLPRNLRPYAKNADDILQQRQTWEGLGYSR